MRCGGSTAGARAKPIGPGPEATAHPTTHTRSGIADIAGSSRDPWSLGLSAQKPCGTKHGLSLPVPLRNRSGKRRGMLRPIASGACKGGGSACQRARVHGVERQGAGRERFRVAQADGIDLSAQGVGMCE